MSRARSIAAMPSLPQWSCACGTGDGTSRKIFSLATDVGLLDHLAPLLVLRPDEPREVLRRIGQQLDTLRSKLGLDVGHREDARDLAVHFLHDVAGDLRRHEEAEPRVHREALQRLADRRRVA